MTDHRASSFVGAPDAPSFWDHPVLGVTLRDAGTSFVLLVAAIAAGLVLRLVLHALRDRSRRLSARWALLDALDRPAAWGVYVLGIWAAVSAFDLPEGGPGAEIVFNLDKFVTRTLTAASVALAVWFGVRLVDNLSAIWAVKAEQTESRFDDQLVPLVRKTGKVFLVVVGGVMIFQELGYSVTSMVAGLGIGGAAFALAAKDTVANLFGAIVIFVDRPFQVGDWVEIGSTEGTVEEIGLRVTQIRTFPNSVITIPNAQLTTTPINNWSRMRKRRIKMTVGVTYDASPDQILEGKAAIEDLIRSDDRFDHDFFLVTFHDFGASSLDYFIYCFTRTTDWKEHLEIREAFLLGIMRRFEAIGLSFAFPSQSLYVEKLPEPPGAPRAMGRAVPL